MMPTQLRTLDIHMHPEYVYHDANSHLEPYFRTHSSWADSAKASSGVTSTFPPV